MAEGNIYISYSRSDRSYLPLASEWLTRLYDEVWYDVQNTPGGQAWWNEILMHIAACDVFIFLASPDSFASKYCLAELDEARRLQKGIVPVLIRPTSLPDDLADLRVVDLSSELVTHNLSRLYKAISYHIEQQKYAATPMPPLSPQPTPLPK